MKQRIESKEEEKLNILTHGIGLFLSFIGLYLLIDKSINYSQKIYLISSCIYGSSLIIMYGCSTMYHYFFHSKFKKQLRIVDHISIYILIAGSYTPGLLLKLQESLGIYLLYVVWGMVIFGAIMKILFLDRFEKFSLQFYIFMGWLIVVDYKALLSIIEPIAAFFLFLGGTFYMIGVIFYSLDRLKYNHVIWHLFVLAGSISHYIMIYKYVI